MLVWDIAKWPVLALLISLVIAMLYWAAPNVRHPGFRWLTPGSVLAVLLWVLASAGFAFYVGNFASYNNIYGSLAGVVVFLVSFKLLGGIDPVDKDRFRSLRLPFVDIALRFL